MNEQLKPCPFCGGSVDSKGWLRGDGMRGPECNGCGATAASILDWNRRTEQAATVPDVPQFKAQVLELIQEECIYWQGRDERMRGNFAILYSKVNELTAPAEADRRDAERYRWLRQGAQGKRFDSDEVPVGSIDYVMQWKGRVFNGLTGKELDEAIDAALAKGKEAT